MSDAVSPVSADTTDAASATEVATLQSAFLDMVVQIGSTIITDQVSDMASEANNE